MSTARTQHIRVSWAGRSSFKISQTFVWFPHIGSKDVVVSFWMNHMGQDRGPKIICPTVDIRLWLYLLLFFLGIFYLRVSVKKIVLEYLSNNCITHDLFLRNLLSEKRFQKIVRLLIFLGKLSSESISQRFVEPMSTLGLENPISVFLEVGDYNFISCSLVCELSGSICQKYFGTQESSGSISTFSEGGWQCLQRTALQPSKIPALICTSPSARTRSTQCWPQCTAPRWRRWIFI